MRHARGAGAGPAGARARRRHRQRPPNPHSTRPTHRPRPAQTRFACSPGVAPTVRQGRAGRRRGGVRRRAAGSRQPAAQRGSGAARHRFGQPCRHTSTHFVQDEELGAIRVLACSGYHECVALCGWVLGCCCSLDTVTPAPRGAPEPPPPPQQQEHTGAHPNWPWIARRARCASAGCPARPGWQGLGRRGDGAPARVQRDAAAGPHMHTHTHTGGQTQEDRNSRKENRASP